MDPLSDVLSLLKPRTYISGGFEVSSDMAIQSPKHQGIKCYAVFSGQCWLSTTEHKPRNGAGPRLFRAHVRLGEHGAPVQ
jgi:hypothetical protein